MIYKVFNAIESHLQSASMSIVVSDASSDEISKAKRCNQEQCGLCPVDEMRCCCGSLLARLVSGGVELKCRRCKRTVILNLNSLESAGS
jgi:hypothetical protein